MSCRENSERLKTLSPPTFQNPPCLLHIFMFYGAVQFPAVMRFFCVCKTLQDYREAEIWREAKNSHWANLPCSSLTSSDRSYSFPPLGLLTSYFFLPAMPFRLLSKSYSIFRSPPDCHFFTVITPCTLALEDKSH